MANRQDQLFHQIGFLARLKSEIVVDAKEQPAKFWGGCGYIAAMMNIDDVINSLMKQQTRIEDLEQLLKVEEEENSEYHRLCGNLEDLYPEIKE